MAESNKSNGTPRRRVKGEPWVWLSGGAVALGIVMIVGLVLLITVEGTSAFWPHDVDAYILGEARFHVHHAEQGQMWVSRDDTMLVVPGAGQAWRDLDGSDANEISGTPRRVTVVEYNAHRAMFERYDALETRLETASRWRLRDRNGRLMLNSAGSGELTVDQFFADPEAYRPGIERGSERDDWQMRVFVDDVERGELFLPEGNDRLLVQVEWRSLDGKAVEFDFLPPRRATVADFREFPQLFEGGNWILAQPTGVVVRDSEGAPVSVATYMENAEGFASPWGYLDEDGKHVSIESMLGDDRWRDHRLLVGAPRGSSREMDLRELPPNPDGTPVRSYQLSTVPREFLIRQGNQGQTLYGSDRYFRWVRTDIPDTEAVRRHRTSSYDDVVLEQVALPHVAVIERLADGVLTGYVTGVTIGDEVLADIERDGREKVWEVFLQEQRRMRELYLRRYDLENKDVGFINFKIKNRDDGLKRIRYQNRRSRNAVTLVDRVNSLHDRWQTLEPMPEEGETPETFEDRLKEWLAQLDTMLDEWREGVLAFEDMTDTDRNAMQEAERLQRERAEIQALEFSVIRFETTRLREEERTSVFRFRTPDGREGDVRLATITRAFRPNEIGLFGKLGVYADRVREYLLDDPRESNTEGGIWPVIVGTLVMVMLMCLAVVPFGVIAALYLREYAKQGPLVSTVRIAVNNLAGVPSIVFGIFGLGFFCWILGTTIDDLFFPELKPAPVFGGGGVMWASLTLALLTVPVVIVATEEALSAVPSSQREASLACGASRWQTVAKVILPQALPGVLTGTILAMARGAGEVAPLMLVGAVKYAPYPPVDAIPPYIHLERKFMHLGFHVYDVGFQSPNVDNTKPLVFATALTLLLLIAVLNLFAITLRNRLRKKYATSAV